MRCQVACQDGWGSARACCEIGEVEGPADGAVIQGDAGAAVEAKERIPVADRIK